MGQRALHRRYPVEAAELAALLKSVLKKSGQRQNALAPKLAIGKSTLNRFLLADGVMLGPTLERFLDLTGASPADRAKAKQLEGIMTGVLSAPPPPPVAPTRPPPAAGVVPPPRKKLTPRQVLRRAVEVGAALVCAGALATGVAAWRAEQLPAPSSIATSDPLPDGKPGPRGHAVFYRERARIVLFDDYPDGLAVILYVTINGRPPFDPWYNSNGRTDPTHLPAVIDLGEYGFSPGDRVEYRVCAGQTKNRGVKPPRDCGRTTRDPG